MWNISGIRFAKFEFYRTTVNEVRIRKLEFYDLSPIENMQEIMLSRNIS